MNESTFQRVLFVLPAALLACGPADDVATDDELEQDAEDASFLADGKADAAGIREGVAEAFAILRLASDLSEADLAARAKVSLGATTAASIAKYRRGKDGREGTADDERFERLTELDRVPNVGPNAFSRLLAYVRAKSLVAPAKAVCGAGRAVSTVAKLPSSIRGAVPDLRLRGGSDRLEIYANDSARISDRAIEDVRLRVCLALEYVTREVRVDPAASALSRPYRIVVLDGATFDTATGAAGSDGLAYTREGADDDAFVLPIKALDDLEELDDTLVHELHHVVAARVAPNDGELTWFLIEGEAVNLGARYGRALYGRIAPWVREHAAAATTADVDLVWSRYGVEDRTKNIDEIEHDQAVSGFFIEHLRARSGFPDAHARLFAVSKKVSAGDSLATAFSGQFPGLTLARAKDGFRAAVDATTGRASERFAGTVFE